MKKKMYLTMIPKDILEYCIKPFLTNRDLMFMNMAITFHDYDTNYYYYESLTNNVSDKSLTIDSRIIVHESEYVVEKYNDWIMFYDDNYNISLLTIYELGSS